MAALSLQVLVAIPLCMPRSPSHGWEWRLEWGLCSKYPRNKHERSFWSWWDDAAYGVPLRMSYSSFSAAKKSRWYLFAPWPFWFLDRTSKSSPLKTVGLSTCYLSRQIECFWQKHTTKYFLKMSSFASSVWVETSVKNEGVMLSGAAAFSMWSSFCCC